MTEPTIHVVDDDEAMRESLSFLLQVNGLAVCAYPSALAVLETLPNLAPGVVVTDMRMPQMSGLDLVRRLRAEGVPHPAIIITGHGDVPLAVEAMKAGVADFIEKPFSDEHMLRAIQEALARPAETGLPAAIDPAAVARFEGLSGREKDVLTGMIAGKPNKIIAFELGISPRTVEIYRANVMSKTGAASLPDLVRTALAAGL